MIIVCVRTRDEAHRIGQFCEAYKDADKILVADGGSLDDTVSIANTFSNVKVLHYKKRVQLKHGLWRNNDSDHANFLFKHAYRYNPSWIIFDDCDIRPNHLLKKNYRTICGERSSTFQHYPLHWEKKMGRDLFGHGEEIWTCGQ
jgi:hypothetical protein